MGNPSGGCRKAAAYFLGLERITHFSIGKERKSLFRFSYFPLMENGTYIREIL
jgi:hypothetical protein